MTQPYPIKVYDTRPPGHQSLSTLPLLGENELARLQAFYGFELRYEHGYERAEPGQLFWGIGGIELKAGPAILQPQVWGEDGTLLTGPDHNILLFTHWPGVEPLPNGTIPDPAYYHNCKAGFTEGKGSVGWGFGQESHIGPAGGPFAVWASSDPATWPDRRVGSDCIDSLGWWDDHIIPNPIFQVMRKAGGTGPTTTAWLGVFEKGELLYHVPLVPGMPPGSFDGFSGLGYINPDGAWSWHVPGVEGIPE